MVGVKLMITHFCTKHEGCEMCNMLMRDGIRSRCAETGEIIPDPVHDRGWRCPLEMVETKEDLERAKQRIDEDFVRLIAECEE